MYVLVVFALAVGLASASPQKRQNQGIVGGDDAVPHEFPWLGVLYYDGSFTCGGSLLQGNDGFFYFLTAAHCLSGRFLSGFKVRLGTYDVSLPLQDFEEEIGFDEGSVHPRYRSSTLIYDIGILRLASSPTLSSQISPAVLPTADFTPGEQAIVAGWGRLYTNGPLPGPLQVLRNQEIQSDSTCRAYLGKRSYKARTMMCAGDLSSSTSACNGDSGGPLMVERDGVMTIVGVVSWGFYCGYPLTVYNDILPSISYINGVMSA